MNFDIIALSLKQVNILADICLSIKSLSGTTIPHTEVSKFES